MKYIVTEQPDADGLKEIFVFPEEVHHDCMAEAVSFIRNQSYGNWERIERKVVSAGFVRGGECVGESETLGLKSDPEDTKLLGY